jgi:hypothetical protein
MTATNANNQASRRRNAQLRRIIVALHKASVKEQKQLQEKFPSMPPAGIGPGWPHIAWGANASRVNKIISTEEKSRKRLVKRLKTFQYPYPEGNKGKKTFYDHVTSLGLLQFLLDPPFLWDIRTAWFFRLDYELEKGQKLALKSQYNYPLEFHRKMMQESFGSLLRTKSLARKYGVPKSWFADYSSGIQKQLLTEAGICYPQMLRGFIPNSRIYPRSFAVDTQMDILEKLRAEFKRQGNSNNMLAYQLTALICSSDSCVTTGLLEPNPAAVRRNERDRRKKAAKLKGRRTAGSTHP